MSHNSVPQECPTRVCPTRVSYKSIPHHKRVPQEFPARVSHKSAPQECPARVSHKSVLQECPARVSYKSVPQECPTRVSHKSVPQECPARVSHKSVPQMGAQGDAADQLAPQAQFRPRAFEKCSALRQISFEKTEYDPANLTRCLPECCFLEAGIVSLHLPADINWTGPAACELSERLQIVDLSRTDIREILGSTFAHCSQLERLSLASKLRRIGREAFLNCASLCEGHAPPALLYMARRAFAGCTQLCTFHKPEARTTWRGPYAEPSAFDKCSQLDIPRWIHLLPPNRSREEWARFLRLRKDLQ